MPQSAAAPSPFPPIAEYAFLSDCHTGALIAPDGAIDWLCVPRFDAPSMFGSLLDRQAGSFRLGPYGINHPTDRHYEPGTNVLSTTWKTPAGWVVVRDALTMGPGERRATRSRRTRGRRRTTTPTTCSCAPSSASTATSRWSWSASPRSTTAATPAEWTLVGDDLHTADATGAGQTVRLRTDLVLGIEGEPGPGRHVAEARREDLLRALLGRGLRGARERRGRRGAARHDRAVLARVAGPGAHPRPPLPRSGAALRADDQGPHLHAHRGHRGGAHHVAAGDPRRRAQLGLPLHLDARHDVHAAGAPLAEPGLGGRRVHAVRRRGRADRGRLAPDHVRHRRPPRPDGVDARRPDRLRRRAAGPDRQRRVRPAPERRLRRGARLDPAAYAPGPAPAAGAVADRESQAGCAEKVWREPRPGHLGGPRQAAALRVVEADVLGRARPRRQARATSAAIPSSNAAGRRPRTRSATTSSSTA